MGRKNNEDRLMAGAAALLLPVFVLLITSGVHVPTFMSGVQSQAQAIDVLREQIASGRIFVPEVLCRILTRYLYPSFIFCLLIGGNIGKFLLRIFFYLRFGLMSLGMYQFGVHHVKVKRIHGLLLGLAYSMSSLALSSGLEASYMNIVIVLPYALCAVDYVIRIGGRSNVWKAVLVLSLFMTGGLHGIIAGVISVLFMIWFMSGFLPGARLWPAFKSLLLSLVIDLAVIIPTVSAGLTFPDLKAAYEDERIYFKFFDVLSSSFNGASVRLPVGGLYPIMSMSVFVLILVILFFLNSSIPFKSKLAGIVMIFSVHVTAAWPLLNTVFSVYGNADAAAFVRFAGLGALLMAMAAVSLKNAGSLGRNEIFGAVAAVIAVVVYSNASGTSEIGRSAFSLWFTSAAAIFWGFALISRLDQKFKLTDILCIIGLIGMAGNALYSFTVSGYTGTAVVLDPYGQEESSYAFASEDGIPLYRGEDEYVAVYSDLRQIDQETVFPYQMNVMANSFIFGDVFSSANPFTVFTDGVNDSGSGFFTAGDADVMSEILIRCENMDPASDYIVFSSFTGNCTLTETYQEGDVITDLTGPFAHKVSRRTDSVTIRQLADAPKESAYLSLWKINGDSLSRLREEAFPMDNFEASVSHNPDITFPGFVTVVTSVPYGNNFDISVKTAGGSVSGETFSYMGRLAVAFQSDGVSDYSFRISSSAFRPVLSVSILVLSYACVVYNIFIRRDKVKKEDPVDNASQND